MKATLQFLLALSAMIWSTHVWVRMAETWRVPDNTTYGTVVAYNYIAWDESSKSSFLLDPGTNVVSLTNNGVWGMWLIWNDPGGEFIPQRVTNDLATNGVSLHGPAGHDVIFEGNKVDTNYTGENVHGGPGSSENVFAP